MDDLTVEKIKKAFFKVKEEINRLEKEKKADKEILNKIIETLGDMSLKIDKLSKIKENKDENTLKKSSIGNEGVRRHHADTTSTTPRQLVDNSQTPTITDLKKEITLKFRRLSEQQFKVFTTIYTLEEEKRQSVTYQDLAKALELSQSCIRDHVSELILRGIPLIKQKATQNKAFLSIPEEFRSLSLFERLIKFHSFDKDQKSLFD